MSTYGYYTRQELRREVGYKLNELYEGTVLSGSVTRITDDNLVDSGASENDHQGSWVLMGGGNAGAVRRVVSYEQTSGTLVLHAALAAAPVVGEAYELHTMLNPEDINRAINWTLRRMRYMTDVVLDPSVYTKLAEATDTINVRGETIHTASQIVGVYHLPNGYLYNGEMEMSPFKWWRARDSASGQQGVYVDSTEFSANEAVLLRVLVPYDELQSDEQISYAPLDWLIPGVLAEIYTLMSRKAPGQDAERFERQALKEAANFTAATMSFAPRPPRKIAKRSYPGLGRGMTESGV